MISGLRVLIVVPARGGSKGLPRKNLRLLRGIPLVAHAARIAQSLEFADRAIVSTDDAEIADVAVQHGLTFLGYRPAELAADFAGDHPVLVHELKTAEAHDRVQYDLVVMLQPTSPLRTAAQVTRAVTLVVDEDLDATWTVSRTDPKFHPLKQLRLSNGRISYYQPEGRTITARQQLEPTVYRNGVAYVIRRSCLLDQGSIMGQNTGACIIDDPVANIDDEADLVRAEAVLAALARDESGQDR